MNKQQRAPWMELIHTLPEVPPAYGDDGGVAYLCNFCKWDKTYEGEEYIDCGHPLDAVNGGGGEALGEDQSDCWGFRPRKGLTRLKAMAEWVDMREQRILDWEEDGKHVGAW